MELKEESIKNKNELEKRQRNAEQNYKDTRSVYFLRKRLWTKRLTQLRSAKQALQQRRTAEAA